MAHRMVKRMEDAPVRGKEDWYNLPNVRRYARRIIEESGEDKVRRLGAVLCDTRGKKAFLKYLTQRSLKMLNMDNVERDADDYDAMLRVGVMLTGVILHAYYSYSLACKMVTENIGD